MSLVLEVPAEIETELRAVAREQGRDLNGYVLSLLEDRALQEKQRRARLAALQELADLSQELDLDRVS